MGRVFEEHSEVLEALRIVVEASDMTHKAIAEKAGITPARLDDLCRISKGTQMYYAEKVLEVLGYEIALKPIRKGK